MNSREGINSIMQQFPRNVRVNESIAFRLHNPVSMINDQVPDPSMESLISVCSANEFGHSCRICRWNRNDISIQQCPCECKGSVGYVHLMCLRRWILHRGNNNCEICGKSFYLPPEKRDYKRLFWSFFQMKYFGAILKNCVQLISIAPITYVILSQVLQIMDHLQLESQDSMQIRVIVLTPTLLLTSSLFNSPFLKLFHTLALDYFLGVIFFHILELSISRCFRIKNIIQHWWKFGGQDQDQTLDTEVPIEFLEFF